MGDSARLEIRSLTPGSLDTKLRGARVFKKATAGCDPTIIGERLTVDLTKCVSVDLAGAAQLLSLLERACLDGIASEVLMPAWGVLQSEIDAWQLRLDQGVDIERTLRDELADRHYVRILLERYGFESALKMTHLPADMRLVVVRDTRMDVAPYDALTETLRRLLSALEELHANVAERIESDLFIPTELRFRWIDRLTRSELTTLVDELEGVLSQGREALPRADARSIARTIVYEALDNVGVHAHPTSGASVRGAALLAAAFVLSSPAGPQELEGRQLHVVLADSGVGIVNTLIGTFNPARHNRLLPSGVRGWTTEQKTVVWAFHPLSTSRDVVVGEPPVRGLSRARQQVRFHGGLIRVRTQDLEVFVSDSSTTVQPDYRVITKTSVPGTLLDFRLLAPKETIDELTFVADLTTRPMEIVPVLVDAMSNRAEELLSVAVVDIPVESVVCLILTGLDFSREGGHEAAGVLARLTSLVSGRATVCILPDVPSGLIFSVLHSLTEQHEHAELLGEGEVAVAGLPDDALMVLGSDRRVTWWGPVNGNEPILVQLAKRAGFSGEAPISDDEEREAILRPSAAPRTVRQWFAHDGLTVSSPQLTDSLADWLQRQVDLAITEGGPGVRIGDELLPSLQPVSRVIDIGATLTALGLTKLAGQIAGDLCRRRLCDHISLMVSLPDVPDEFAQAFAMAAGYDGRRLQLDPSRDGWRLGSIPEHRAGKALLIGGFSTRGESLRAVAEALMRWGIEPQLALIIADARIGAGSTLRALDADIPVLSLTRLHTSPAQTPYDQLLDIRERAEQLTAARYPIPPARLAQLLESHGDGFKLVHVERSEDRHLVGYYDFRSVLADEYLRGELAGTVTNLVVELSPIAQADGHVILYPADDINRAAVLARDVCDRLPGATVRPLRRDSATQPSDELWAAGKVATFVDWGVVTARTARAALDEMANAGALHANFIAVASQLDPETEHHLVALASVYGRTSDSTSGQLPLDRPLSTPVTVAFRPITRIASTAYTRASCPLCRAVADFVTYSEECPTDFLRNHAREKVELLRARPRDEALSTSADLYGADLNFAERSNLIKVWSILDRARTSVVARDQLQVLLTDTSDPDYELTAASMCRILATRHDLLHSPPLSDAQYRRLIVERSLPMLLGDPKVGYVPSPLKRQAVVTLRAASKEHFVQNIAAILESNLRSRTVRMSRPVWNLG